MNVIIEQLCQELWRKDFIVFRHCAHNLVDAIFFSSFNVILSDNFCRLSDSTRENYFTSPRQSRRLCHELIVSGSHVCAHARELMVRQVTAMRLFTCELNAEKIQ